MPNSRVAIVTGGGRGIGAATASLLGQQGYHVCVNYRTNDAAAREIVDELKSQGMNAIPVKADIGDADDAARLFATVDRELGSLTALVNNAAIVAPHARVEELDPGRIENIMRTNVLGTFFCCKEAIKRMSTRHGGTGGAIVNVSSVAARTGSPGEYVDYAASKGAVDTLTKGLSLELAADGIRVNAVRPGFIYTEMHADGGEPGRVDRLAASIPLQRGGTPDEVAQSIAWLLSDAASFVTGAFIDIAGGR